MLSASSRSPASADIAPPATPARSSKNFGRSVIGPSIHVAGPWAYTWNYPGTMSARMILVTGGAGFIGSALHAALARRGERYVIADWLGAEGKWRNLRRHPPERILCPEQLDDFLRAARRSTQSSTSAPSARPPRPTPTWSGPPMSNCRGAYGAGAPRTASGFSMPPRPATYGDGSGGFDDDPALAAPPAAAEPLRLDASTPSTCLWPPRSTAARNARRNGPDSKFFNVYGPNEYHKGPMNWVVKRRWAASAEGAGPAVPLRPARHRRRGAADTSSLGGGALDMLLFLLANPGRVGALNVGTGKARCFVDLARAVCAAGGSASRSNSSPMPEAIRANYQNFTEARLDRLRAAGYTAPIPQAARARGQALRGHPGKFGPYLMGNPSMIPLAPLSRHRPHRSSRSAPSPSAGTRSPISSGSSSAGGHAPLARRSPP